MAVQHDQTDARIPGDLAADCPHPLSLETIGLMEQVLAGMLRSLRGQAGAAASAQAGATEYDSWQTHAH